MEQKLDAYIKVRKDEYEKFKSIKQIIIDKIDEITKEYQIILNCNREDLDYINLCTHQYNSMKTVLEEVLERLG